MTKPQETASEKCRCSRGPFLLVHFSGKVFDFDSERPGTPVDSMETEESWHKECPQVPK